MRPEDIFQAIGDVDEELLLRSAQAEIVGERPQDEAEQASRNGSVEGSADSPEQIDQVPKKDKVSKIMHISRWVSLAACACLVVAVLVIVQRMPKPTSTQSYNTDTTTDSVNTTIDSASESAAETGMETAAEASAESAAENTDAGAPVAATYSDNPPGDAGDQATYSDSVAVGAADEAAAASADEAADSGAPLAPGMKNIAIADAPYIKIGDRIYYHINQEDLPDQDLSKLGEKAGTITQASDQDLIGGDAYYIEGTDIICVKNHEEYQYFRGE